MSKLFISIVFLLFAFSVNATTFRKLPLNLMVEESTAAAEVKLVAKRTFMNNMGMILTEHAFLVVEGYNLEGELIDNILKIELTGGTINGITSYVDGAPEFSIGERSFLLLKKIENKIYLSNFTLGKYRIVEEEDSTFYVTTVYPADPEIGKVSNEKLVRLIKEKFKISDSVMLQKKEDRKISDSPNEFKTIIPARLPAQDYPTKEKDFPYMLMFWTIASFVISGLIAYSVFKKEK